MEENEIEFDPEEFWFDYPWDLERAYDIATFNYECQVFNELDRRIPYGNAR